MANPFMDSQVAQEDSNPFLDQQAAAEEDPNPFGDPTLNENPNPFGTPSPQKQAGTGGGRRKKSLQPQRTAPAPDVPPAAQEQGGGGPELSYIEMMCAAPRDDNEAAREILSPEHNSPVIARRATQAQPRRGSPSPKKNQPRSASTSAASRPIVGKKGAGGEKAALNAMKERIRNAACLGGGVSTSGADFRQYLSRKLRKETPTSGPAEMTFPNSVSVSPLVIKGHLTKQGSVRKNWLERWFVLDIRKGTLTYYATMNEDPANCKGEILLKDITRAIHLVSEAQKGSHKFSIITKGRTYNVQADTHNAMRVWMEAVNAVGSGEEVF